MDRIDVKKDEPLNPGDIIELHFSAIGPTWIKSTQIAVVEYALKNQKSFELLRTDYWQPNEVVFRARVKQPNPVVVTVALIAAAIAAVPIAFGWMFTKAYKLVDNPVGKMAVGGISIGVLAAGVAALLAFLPKK